jgi:hypothetical protein
MMQGTKCDLETTERLIEQAEGSQEAEAEAKEKLRKYISFHSYPRMPKWFLFSAMTLL